ncbi:BTAD domain-containing putative transcriptional regulator [Actinoplanes sp. NPDC024001]|uniref:AfsR/SARP family transcriptional regulator n=1 Tax=Actinoplanes sp. NPDC024001 TaxID=3154598 RepID=UPI0033E734CE
MDAWAQLLGTEGATVLHLFGGPYVTAPARRISVPEGSKRLLAFVALHGDRVERRHAAGTLWPAGDDLRAAGNLRSSLWRLNRGCVPLIEAGKSSLSLRGDVVVDVHVITRWANRLIDGRPTATDLTVRPSGVDGLDLLPGWYDDWALMERERIRQRLLHALESLSATLLGLGRCREAVEAAMVAATNEPLRESAQRTLLAAHLAEGNWVEAKRQFTSYRRLLNTELGIEPHPCLFAMVRPGRAYAPAER